MTLTTDEFIRRFLIHVLPEGFRRIRHYGLFAKGTCADNVARGRPFKLPELAYQGRRGFLQAHLSVLRWSYDHHRRL